MNLNDLIIEKVKDLPTLPTVYSALCDVIEDPNSTVADVARVISLDQASVIRILRVANSAFFGFSGCVDSISRAILILGFNEVRNLVLASSVMNLFNKSDSLRRFRPQDFWTHSVGVGLITRLFGQMAGFRRLENFFITGILHDIGKIFFFEFLKDEYPRVLALVNEKKCLIREAELEILGMDHALIGSLVADQWKLPEQIRNAIHYHHFGAIGEQADFLVASVHLGDILARVLELGYPGDDLIPRPSECVWETLKLRPGMVTQMIPKVLKDFEETVSAIFLA